MKENKLVGMAVRLMVAGAMVAFFSNLACKKTDKSDEEDVVSPGVMPQQANYDANDDSAVEEEEDIDKLAEELDELEDITSWVQQDSDAPENTAKKKKARKSGKTTKKKATKKKAAKKKTKKAKKAVKSKKVVKTKKSKKS